MIKKIIFSSLIAVTFLLNVKAQGGATFDKLVDFLPPAPNAAAITRYGEASVNKNTGTPNINIPIFTVKGNKLSTNINLGYSSGGIKVDEVASRAGMGWAINAGGVITRTVRGMPDITNTRHYPYAAFGLNWATYNYMKRIAQSQNNWGYSGGFDAEPDLFNFSFDGYSGSFVFDGNGIALVNKSGIKVEYTGIFTITTPDGVKYFFGGPSATEKTKREQSCGRTYNVPIATAWYLTEINHPNGEKILFTYSPHTYQYESGVSQTMYDPGFGDGCCPPEPTTTCINFSKTYGVLLTKIESPGKALASFNYTDRQDCDDKLIFKITLNGPANTIGSFNFTYSTITANAYYNNELGLTGYNKIPYLTSLTENSSDNSLQKRHYFSYIDPAGRPARLSFSQDHWGYFNGKTNTTLTPNLGGHTSLAFPLATANRQPEFAAAQKGMLQKIVYPTGGTTHIFYEPNLYDDGNLNTYGTKHNLSCDVTGTGNWATQTKTKNFSVQNGQVAQLQIECRDNSGIGDYDPIHNKGSVELFLVGVYSPPMILSPGYNNTISINLAAGNYQLIIGANGAVVTTLVTLKFITNYVNSVSSANIAGGIRVQKIATANPGEAPLVKRYFYGKLDNLNQSSMHYIMQPGYYGSMKKVTCGGQFVCDYGTLSSSSINNLGFYNNTIIGYHSVVESIGENFEGGGIETQFNVNTDGLGQVVWNNDIINSPFTNYSSFYNAKPRSETIVKKMPDNTLKPVKKTVYTYKNEPAAENTVYGYSVVEKVPNYGIWYDTTCIPVYDPHPASCYNNLSRGLSLYDVVRYTVFSSFVYPDTETQTLWDENGENPIVTTRNSFFDNLNNYQLTGATQTNSKDQLIKTTNKYPHDYVNEQVYADMVLANNIAALVNTKSEIINPGSVPPDPLAEQQIDYGSIGALHFAPVAVKKAVKGNALEVEGTINQYDAQGNILQFTNKAGIVSSIIWGYNYQYPVAQVIGAAYASATAQLTVSVATLQTMDGAALLAELNRIRTNLPGAGVTTYTYKHLTGITSITDVNNKTNSYEYDTFNRLKHIKDQDGNYVKKNEYVYVSPSPNAGITIYYNQAISQQLSCNSCLPGFGTSPANPVSYTVPAGKYYSLISQQDADAKAALDMATYGQEYVNKNSTCSNSATCTGGGYKFVSCACELGQRICESSAPYNGGWLSYLHLRWSDGSVSPTFSEFTASCTGVDKKFLSCNCETGVKICNNVVNNGGGSYTITYHYKWSDNSTSSPPITETITCSGPDKKMIGCNCETAVKWCVSAQYCGGLNQPPGCCPGMWLSGFYYRWSDGSTSGSAQNPFYECRATPCVIE